MPRTRSRTKTEEKFKDAVLELIVSEGCGSLGINAVAQRAGADKVLIYRYFGDFEGLMAAVAGSRQWLPTEVEVFAALPSASGPGPLQALRLLREIETTLLDQIRTDACALQLLRWRRTGICPVCRIFSQAWENLWRKLPALLTQGLSKDQRDRWHRASALLALIIEAELCGDTVNREYLEPIASGLEDIHIQKDFFKAGGESMPDPEDRLPTNLL
jgi:AcrR family transcriptional regulator